MSATDIQKIENLLREVLDKINGIDSPKLDESASAEFIKKFESLNKKFDKKSKDFINEIKESLEKYQATNSELMENVDSALPENIRDFIASIAKEMAELKELFEKFNEEYVDISVNTSMAESKEIISLKNCVQSLNDTMDAIKEKVDSYNFKEELVPPISENVTTSINESVISNLNEFKKELFELLAKISDGINNIFENEKIFQGFELSLGEILQTQQKNKDEIIKIIIANIEEENKKLLPKILQMVNAVSFDEAAEEIKDGLYALNENLGIVNKNIEAGSLSSEKILEKVDDISGKFTDFDIVDKISKIDAVLESVSSDFNVITKGSRIDSNDYVYTLLDLESDISKVRIVLNELNNTIQDDRSLAESVTKSLSDKIAQVNTFIEKTAKLYADTDYKTLIAQFDSLNDDITSISKRTNKLILTSDDSAVKLQQNIENFQSLINKINATVENFEKSSVIKVLAKRTESLQKFMKDSIQSDNAMNEAFTYLATWIDSTTSEIETIKSEISEIKNLIAINNENSVETDTAKIEKLIKDTNKKLSDNTNRIDSLEEKIDTVTSQMQMLADSISATKNSSKKIDKIEKQIQLLISYVEED